MMIMMMMIPCLFHDDDSMMMMIPCLFHDDDSMMKMVVVAVNGCMNGGEEKTCHGPGRTSLALKTLWRTMSSAVASGRLAYRRGMIRAAGLASRTTEMALREALLSGTATSGAHTLTRFTPLCGWTEERVSSQDRIVSASVWPTWTQRRGLESGCWPTRWAHPPPAR
jgi:hypothetical protein